jgi:hypothetical protein
MEIRAFQKILAILFITSLFFLSLASAEINLSTSPADSITPQITIDHHGRILVLWIEMDWPLPGIGDVLYTTLENGSWAEIRETISQLYDARNPHLINDSEGIPHMTYDDGNSATTRDIFYRKFSFEDNHWSNIQRVFLTGLNSAKPKIGIDRDNKMYVMWVQQYGQNAENKIVMNSKYEQEIWPETFEDVSRNTNSSANQPCFEVRDGNVYACWMDNRDGKWDLLYNEKMNDVWKIPVKLNSSGEMYYPSLVLDQEGHIHIICSSKSGNFFYFRKANQTWSSPLIISTGFSPTRFSDLQLFKDNTLHAVWVQKTASEASILYGRATSEGNWLDPIVITVGTKANHPKIELDDSGTAHIVWEDIGQNNKKDVFYKTISPPGSNPVAAFSSSEDSGIIPHTVHFDASESSPGGEEIRSYWWDFGDGSQMEQGRQVSHTYNEPGIFPVKLYVTDQQLLVGFHSEDMHVLGGPFPPLNIIVAKADDGGVFYRSKINAIRWEENPKNEGKVIISHHNIYRKIKNQANTELKIIGQASHPALKFADREFLSPDERDGFSYAVSAVDTMGREGPMGFANGYEPDGGKKNFRSSIKEIQ